MTTDPTAMTLPVRCPDCGPMLVLLDGVVIVHIGTDERATFMCPKCTVPASMTLHPVRVSALRFGQGVPYVDLPAEPTRLAGELTDADCERFERQIARTAFVARAAAMA